MVNTAGFREEWYRRSDVLEALHFIARADDPINAETLRDRRKTGSLNSNDLLLRMLEDIGVLEVEGEGYVIDYTAFGALAEDWIGSLSELQRRFINTFCRVYVRDKKRGTVRRMIAGDMVQGILTERDALDGEIVELADRITVAAEDYADPAEYVHRVMDEIG